MSKSTGNFLTLSQAINKFSADGTCCVLIYDMASFTALTLSVFTVVQNHNGVEMHVVHAP